MRFRPYLVFLACLGFCCAPPAVFAQPSDATSPAPVAKPEAGASEAGKQAQRARHRGGLPDDVPGLQKAAVEAYESGNYLRFVQATIKLRNQRPYEPEYLIGMVVGTALLGRQTTAYSYMHKMQQQGLSFDFDSTPDTEKIRGTEVYDYINDLLIRAGDPLGEVEVGFTLPKAARYPEAIEWDPTRQRFLVGTLESGSVLAVSADGKRETLLEADAVADMWSVQGLAVDAERKRLWVATAALPAYRKLEPADLGKSALLGFDLESLELLERHDLSPDVAPHVLGSVDVLPSGDVFVIDRAVPLLYRKPLSGKALEPFLGARELVSFRDLAASADGQRLYVADADMGILVVDPGRQESAMLAGPETLNLGGITGLMVSGNALLTLQGRIRPQRLMRLELDDTGRSVTAVKPIANAMESFNFPSFGTVHEGFAYYFASSNLPGANEGQVRPVVLKSPVELPEGYETPEHLKFRDDTFGKNPPDGESDR